MSKFTKGKWKVAENGIISTTLPPEKDENISRSEIVMCERLIVNAGIKEVISRKEGG